MRDRFRRHPVTAGYLLAVAGLALLMRFVFADEASAQVHESFSTNARNLADHPLSALLCSAFVLDPDDGPAFTASALAAVAVCLGRFERETGPWRAAAVVLAGHVGATLTTAAVISSGVYPTDLTDVLDVGIGYAAFAAAGAATALVPLVLRPPWLALVVAYPLITAPWSGSSWLGAVPDFEAVGHVAAALLGAAGGALALRRSSAAVGR
ncbi:rhomboid-like protein [Saccharothrix xinjiangensis]|uniref:Rhomboid-like protein n=1 Tax=Saccharothrix xinjiangensis TaxID=204798 RepID=A0ABV9XT39_9PSEU